MEMVVFLAILIPGLFLAATRSGMLMDYAIWVLALNRGVRRMVDYYFNEQFNPVSLISLTPLTIGTLLLLVGLSRCRLLHGKPQQIFLLFCGALLWGCFVGVFFNGGGAIYSLGEWISGLGAMLFATTLPQINKGVGDRWMRTSVWAGLVVAAYGWWQYYTIPSWDAMWLVQAGQVGYMGNPEPMQMTLFSTMNERGPCAMFLAYASLPLILNPRWRVLGGWVPLIFLLSTITLTGVRSAFIFIGVVSLVYPLVAKGRGLGRIVLLASLVTLAAVYGLDKLPNPERFKERFSAESLSGEGSSLHGRIQTYRWAAIVVLNNPWGLGLGSSGMASRATGGNAVSIGDAGYMQIMSQLGGPGSLCFFGALYLLWKEMGRRLFWSRTYPHAPTVAFLTMGRALLLSILVQLFVGDVFSGFSLIWIVFGCAVHVSGRTPAIGENLDGTASQIIEPVPIR